MGNLSPCPTILYSADFTSPSGYSRAARAHAKALIEAGVDVIFSNKKHDVSTIPLDPWWEKEFAERSRRKERTLVHIMHHTPDLCAPSPSQLNIGMVAWETSRIPDIDIQNNPRLNWVKQLNKLDLVWTFCHSAKKAMLDSGVRTNIDVFPHPIDAQIYRPLKEEKKESLFDQFKGPLDHYFKFLSVFHWTPRKDPRSMLLAFMTEFRYDEPVALLLKTYHVQTGDLAPIKKVIEAMRGEVKLPYRGPKILLIPGVLSDLQMGDLMRSVDCMVTSTKAEGFDLPLAEAMSCGIPCVAPHGSAMLDYINNSNGYPVKTYDEPVHGITHSPWYFSTQTWHVSDIMDMRRRMREAFNERDKAEYKKRSEEAIKTVRTFSSDVIGKRMRKAIEDLVAGAGVKRTGSSTPSHKHAFVQA